MATQACAKDGVVLEAIPDDPFIKRAFFFRLCSTLDSLGIDPESVIICTNTLAVNLSPRLFDGEIAAPLMRAARAT